MSRVPQLHTDSFEVVALARRGPDGKFYVAEVTDGGQRRPFAGQPGDGWPSLKLVTAHLEAGGWRVAQQLENGNDELYVVFHKPQPEDK